MKLLYLSWLTGLLGFALLVTGVTLVSLPAGLIVAGGGLLFWSWLADRASAVQATAGEG